MARIAKVFKMIRHIIKKLYFKYCFTKESFASQIAIYFIPGKIDGQYFITQINDHIKNNDKMFNLIAEFNRLDGKEEIKNHDEFDIKNYTDFR